MRFRRVKAEGQGFYHIISRTVAGLFLFGTSGKRCNAAEKFLSLMQSFGRFQWSADFGLHVDVQSLSSGLFCA